MLTTKRVYAMALYRDPDATLDHLHEAVNTLEEIERTARRVLGGTHPTTGRTEVALRESRAALRAREWGPWYFAFAVAVVAWGVWCR